MKQTDLERVLAIKDAQEAILEAVAMVRMAVRGTRHEDWAERMVVAHLECAATSDHGWLDRSANLDQLLKYLRADGASCPACECEEVEQVRENVFACTECGEEVEVR